MANIEEFDLGTDSNISSSESYDMESSESDNEDSGERLFDREEHKYFRQIMEGDSSSEEDFCGFGDEGYMDVPHERPQQLEDLESFMNNWEEGDRERVDLPFTAPVGLRRYANVPENPKPIDFFNLFFDEEHFEIMATQTNLYANQLLQEAEMTEHSRLRDWIATNKHEMKLFMAMIIAMGLVVLGDISEYWSLNEVTSTPFFPRCMARDRFWILLTFFHLADNTTLPQRDSPAYSPLNKLGSIYQNIIHRYTSIYQPSQYLSLDEGMVPWRGNLHFRVYSPNKPKKYGMKAFMLCDSSNGYCFKFRLYTGKFAKNDVSEHGVTYDLVMDMMKDYHGKGFHLFVDNYYSSPTLFVNLWARGIGATGTLRATRKGTHKKLANVRLNRGETYVMHNKNLLGVRYHDRKYVTLLSTVETAEMVPTGKVYRGTDEPVLRPSLVLEYDKYMGGVDRADQLCSYTPFRNKTMKWWKRLFFHACLNLAIVNSYVIYKSVTKDKKVKRSRKFKMEIITSLVDSVRDEDLPVQRRRSRIPAQKETLSRMKGRHFPQKAVPVARRKNISRTCVVCSAAAKRIAKSRKDPTKNKNKHYGRQTQFECDTCNVALCPVPCFKLFHSVEDYVTKYIIMKDTAAKAAALEAAYAADTESGTEEETVVDIYNRETESDATTSAAVVEVSQSMDTDSD